jgi:hypothetical protein
MDLQELNNAIHSANKSELQTNLATWKAEIKSILELGREEDEIYFISHTGRELFRKLYNFGLDSEIKDDYDSGFQPISAKRFDPKSINTVAWYDASDTSTITHDVSGITKWLDKSGTGNDLTPLSAPWNAPKTLNHSIQQNTLNGLSTLSLDADDYFMKEKVSLPTPSGNVNVFIVAKIPSVSHGSAAIFSLQENTAGEGVMDFQLDAGSANKYNARVNCTNAAGASANVNTSPAGDFTNQWAIFSAVFDFDDTSKFLSYVNGINVGTPRPYTNKMTGGNAVDPTELKVFSNRGANQSVEGNVAEVLYCENSSNDTREKIEAYLAYKWGLVSELDSTHPHKNSGYKTFNP